MKLTILFLFHVSLVFGFYQNHGEVGRIVPPVTLSSENNNPELVVVFESYNRKFYEEVISQISQIQGLKMKGYCESLHCFYFEIDTIIFKSTAEAFQALELKTKKFLPVFKEGTTAIMVVSNCPRI